jgi:hypothetical protein
MGSSLLTLVQDACAELGLSVPGTVAGATDQQTTQMFALANAVGADLLSRNQWTALQTQAIVAVESPIVTTGTTTDGSAVVTDVPADLLGLTPAWYIASGNTIPTSARLTEITVNMPGDDSFTMDTLASGSEAGQAITLSRDTYPVPADFVTFINDTQWDRGNHWRLQGPASPQEDQWLRSGIVTTGPRRWFRQVGRGLDVFRLWPPPGTNDVPGPLSYEYLSKYWAMDSGAVPKARFSADSDTCIWDDRLLVEGIKWRFFAAKGFDYASSFALWQRQLDVAMARDGGAATLSMTRRKWPIFLSPANVQAGNFPGPGNT